MDQTQENISSYVVYDSKDHKIKFWLQNDQITNQWTSIGFHGFMASFPAAPCPGQPLATDHVVDQMLSAEGWDVGWDMLG